jgi:hypothetical protein
VGTPPPPEKDAHPNRGTLGVQRTDRMWLSAEQLHDHENEPSWKAAEEPKPRYGPARIATIAILLVILALVIYLKATGAV